MTAPTIPRGLVPLVSDFSGGAPGGVDRTEIEGGAPRYAMAYDRGLQQYSVLMFMTPLQLSVWTTFFLRKIAKGAVSFVMEIDSGFGASPHTVNIVPGSYSVTRRMTNSLVSFVVEAESQAWAMTGADADALLELYEESGDETSALLRRLEVFALSDTLVLDF